MWVLYGFTFLINYTFYTDTEDGLHSTLHTNSPHHTSTRQTMIASRNLQFQGLGSTPPDATRRGVPRASSRTYSAEAAHRSSSRARRMGSGCVAPASCCRCTMRPVREPRTTSS